MQESFTCPLSQPGFTARPLHRLRSPVSNLSTLLHRPRATSESTLWATVPGGSTASLLRPNVARPRHHPCPITIKRRAIPVVSLAFAVITIASAHPASHLKPRADTCPLDARTCTGQVVDACCLPDNGIMVLAQQWFQGLGPSDEFTLHGLWPDSCDGGIVENCDPSRDYNDVESRLWSYHDPRDGFMQDMKDYWSSYRKAEGNESANNVFWSHEWKTHGTCVSTLNPSCFSNFARDQDLYMFFNRTLALRKEFNIFPALAQAGITPGPMYNVDKFHTAIRDYFNVDAAIECKHGLPLEIHLYFFVESGDTYLLTDPGTLGSCKGMVHFPKK